MGGFCLLVELHREGSVPAACAVGLFNQTQMKMTYLSRSLPNMKFNGKVCDSLEKDSLTLFLGNHWAAC